MVREGMFVKPGMEMMVIGQLEHIWVIGEVFERQVMSVREGDAVRMYLDYLPGRTWSGTVDYIYPSLNTQTRTARVRVRFDNPDGYLRPGMFAQMTIATQPAREALLIPREALIRTGSQSRVVLAKGDGRFKSIAVEVGRIGENRVEILSGLNEGDQLVTSAQFLIDSESSKTSDFRRMNHSPDDDTQPGTPASVSVGARIEGVMVEHRMLKLAHDPIDAWQWPAMTMVETFIQLKPREEWRDGMTTESLKKELDALVKFPGLTNAWVMPIKTRIDMLATGIKTPVGIKVAGPDLREIEKIGKRLEQVLKDVPGTASVYSERVAGGRYIKVDIQRDKAARYGLNIADVQQVVATAIGGMNVAQTIEGLERYPVNLRYPQDYRNSPEQLALLPIVTTSGQRIALGDVARVYVEDGPPAIKSENARLNGWTFVDIDGVDIGSYVTNAMAVVADQIELPAGYSLNWSGQYEYKLRAKEKLTFVVPLTLGIIIVLLYLNFRSVAEVAIIMGTLPLAMVGSIWLMYLLGYNFSVAVGVGFIALAGVAVEIGVIMLVYLNQAYRHMLEECEQKGVEPRKETLRHAVLHGAGLRVRPVMMTAAAIIVGLLPIMYGTGTGSEVMSRIAAPMVGGMLSAVVLTLLVLPAVYLLWKQSKGNDGT
jgi:AcrB/AcrD/AcrF family protein/HlyD family secretion protein/copper binding protein CusF